MPLLLSRISFAGASLVFCFVFVAGCAVDPKASLPNVQQQVSARGDLTVSWPQTSREKQEADEAVNQRLKSELTADTAVGIALLNNRNLRATFEDLGLSQADLVAAGRLHNPVFAASARWPDRSPRGPDIEFSLVADLLDDLLIPLRKRVARTELDQAERRVSQEVLSLAAEVKITLYTAQAGELLKTRLAKILEANATASELAQRQYDAGNINQLELAHQQLVAQETKLEMLRAETQIRRDREKLNRLLGLSGGQTQWKLTEGLPDLPPDEIDPDPLVEQALAQRLDLASAKSRVTLAEAALDLKRKTRLLPVGATLGIDTERESAGDRLTGPRVELTLPLFDQGQVELARLGAALRQAQDRYEALLAEAGSEVREACEALRAAHAAADFFAKTLLPQRKLILHETLLHYNAMQKSNYELLAAAEEQMRTERESLETLRDYWIARVRLEQAVGGNLKMNTKQAVSSSAHHENEAPGAAPMTHHTHENHADP